MFGISSTGKAAIAACFVVLAFALLMSGCGSSEENYSAPTNSVNTAPTSAIPTGPALSDKLSFDQLALESPVTKVSDKSGIAYLHFKYADMDGKVYKVEMPEAMSAGAYPAEEWLRTFKVYRLPEVLKQKKVENKDGKQGIADFPFISPREGAVTTPSESQDNTQEPTQSPAPGRPQYTPPGG